MMMQQLLKRHSGFERLGITSDMSVEQYRRAISKNDPNIDAIIKGARVMSSTERLLIAALMSACDYAWAAQEIAPDFWWLWNLLDEEQTQIVIGLLHNGKN